METIKSEAQVLTTKLRRRDQAGNGCVVVFVGRFWGGIDRTLLLTPTLSSIGDGGEGEVFGRRDGLRGVDDRWELLVGSGIKGTD